jgi:hypothetical protein
MAATYIPLMRVLVVAALVLATAALIVVTINSARAAARFALTRPGHSAVRLMPVAPPRPAPRAHLLSS